MCGKQWRIALNKTKKLKKSAEQWLLDRSTLRRIEDKTNVNFSAKWKQVQKYADHVYEPLHNLKLNLHKTSKILILDGKYVNIRGESICIHIACDTAIGVVDFRIDDAENKTAYAYILQRLKKIGYEPICCISDDNLSISSLLEEEKIPHQLCIFHLLKSLRVMVSQKNGFFTSIRPDCKVLFSRIKGIFKTTQIEKLPPKIDQFRQLGICWKTQLHGRVLKWFWEKVQYAVMGLSFDEKIPKTSNMLENINGQIEARLKTFRGVKSEASLNKILKILFFFRNFK